MKKIFLFSFFILVFLFFSIYSYSNMISKDISSSVVRLHIIANSDSDYDQQLKFKVRNSLLNYMNTINFNSDSKSESVNNILLNLDNFSQVAKQTISSNGFDYDVRVQYDNVFFPTKQYNNISLPAGNYDALKVTIGNGNGHNWWCVMFPPLCFVDTNSSTFTDNSIDYLNEILSDEDIDLITKESCPYEFKFKIVEIFNNLKNKIN